MWISRTKDNSYQVWRFWSLHLLLLKVLQNIWFSKITTFINPAPLWLKLPIFWGGIRFQCTPTEKKKRGKVNSSADVFRSIYSPLYSVFVSTFWTLNTEPATYLHLFNRVFAGNSCPLWLDEYQRDGKSYAKSV